MIIVVFAQFMHFLIFREDSDLLSTIAIINIVCGVVLKFYLYYEILVDEKWKRRNHDIIRLSSGRKIIFFHLKLID